jgi:hypothetical protein
MKNKKIKTEEQAKDFIIRSLVKHLEKCGDKLCPDYVGELSFLVMGTIAYENFGGEMFEELVKEIRRVNTELLDDSPEIGSKNKYH